jgi:hypothetical protein
MRDQGRMLDLGMKLSARYAAGTDCMQTPLVSLLSDPACTAATHGECISHAIAQKKKPTRVRLVEFSGGFCTWPNGARSRPLKKAFGSVQRAWPSHLLGW